MKRFINNNAILFVILLFQFQISGLLNNEDASKLISAFITDMVPSFIEDHAKWMTDTYSPMVSFILDNLNLEVSNIFGEAQKL